MAERKIPKQNHARTMWKNSMFARYGVENVSREWHFVECALSTIPYVELEIARHFCCAEKSSIVIDVLQSWHLFSDLSEVISRPHFFEIRLMDACWRMKHLRFHFDAQ
jgi:hypothetical protein